MYFSSNLEYLRKLRKLSQSIVAEQFNLGSNTIGSYERGDRQPTLECLIGLAMFYDVSIDDLLLKDMCPKEGLLSSNIKYLRKQKGHTQSELAKLLNLERSTIAGYETEGKEPGIKILVSISKNYGVSVDDLLKKDLEKEGF